MVPPTAAQYGSSRNINTLGVAGGGGARAQVGMATRAHAVAFYYVPGNGESGSKGRGSPGGVVGGIVYAVSDGAALAWHGAGGACVCCGWSGEALNAGATTQHYLFVSRLTAQKKAFTNHDHDNFFHFSERRGLLRPPSSSPASPQAGTALSSLLTLFHFWHFMYFSFRSAMWNTCYVLRLRGTWYCCKYK